MGYRSYGSFAAWMRKVYWLEEWGESKANTFSLYKEGGETGYTGQEDLKFINNYIIGDGREGQ